MTMFLDPERFNMAHTTRRHAPLAWVLLGLSVLLCVFSLYPLRQSLQALDDVSAQQREFNKISKHQADTLRKENLQNSSLPTLERDKAQRQLQDFVHMSWDGIFDALEVAVDAVRSGVSIVALVPAKVQPSNVELNITALASNTPIMLTYLKALKADLRILQVELATQQPDEKTGPGVIRFQFNVVFNPKINVDHPPRIARPLLPPTLAAAPASAIGRHNVIVPPDVLNSAATPTLPEATEP
jgi:hypothetical protein